MLILIRLGVRLIEGVRLIGGPLNRGGVTVFNHKLFQVE